MERSRILQRAIENRHAEMVAVVVPYADSVTLDAALPLAIRSGDVTMVQLLLQRGANTAQTRDGQDAFRQMCIVGGHADIVGLILQSEGRPAPGWVSMAMVDAARKGCLETVLRLSRSTADGDYNNAEALKTAVAQCRVDIALAILTGTKPPAPGGQGLIDSFAALFEHPAVGPNDKVDLTEALLCAGATGDAVSLALAQACVTEFYDMVDLLVSYGASVEFQDASVLRNAVAKGQSSLVQLLLNESSTLSPKYASECVEHIPKTISPEDRHAILSILLRKGATGTPLSDALIVAVQACDLQSVELLLTPHFPGSGRLAASHDLRKGPRGMVYDRHEIASVDHRNGLALSIAVMMGNMPMVNQLLAGKPSAETLEQAFPQIHELPPVQRYQVAELFLSTGLSGPCVSVALQAAIEEEPPQRDENFINLLLRYNADVNFNDGAGILSAVAHQDIALLEAMLKSKPTAQTMAAAMSKAMMIDDRPVRYRMVSMLINAGAGREGEEVSEALAQILSVKPTDVQLATLLLDQGRADANFNQGLPLVNAIHDPNPTVLDLVLQKGRPSPETLARGLDVLSEMATTPEKVAKFDAILRRSKQKELLSALLFKEAQTLLKSPLEKRNLAVVKLLLAAGADVNAHKAATLCCAVKSADTPISDLIFNARPNPVSLSAALPHSLNIVDAMDRLTFTQRLVDAGAPSSETNRALIYAIAAHPNDLPLIGLLAAHADSIDGEALMAAVKQEKMEIVDILLSKSPRKYSVAVLSSAFQEATKAKDRKRRAAVCKYLLQRGVSGTVVSEALLAAAADGDVALGGILMDHGASVEHQEGESIVAACAAGAPDVLEMLLTSKVEVKKQTLAKGFQAATQVGDLKKRAEVFRLLLEKGVSGEVVDAQLISAAKFGDEGEPLVRMLLEFGASVDYNAGEAVWNATRSAIMGSLKLLLGVDKVAGDRQKKPSKATLLRALKASRKLSRDPRYQVIEWLFGAGLPASEEIHIALNRAVKDEPDLRLIRLLLKHGASPLHNGCETLIDAAQLLLADILAALLESEIPQKDISWAFQQAFTPETASTWLSEQGFKVAKMLLEKGAEGESLSLALSTAIDFYGTDQDSMARQFAALLLQSKADASYQDGLVVQKAAQRADSELIQQVLQQKPNSHAVSMAFPYIFDPDLSEADTLHLMTLFTDYHDGEERLDALFTHPHSEPVMFRALSRFPRSVKILQTLFDAGYYHDQMTSIRVMDEVDEDEQVSLLFWALLQPQKKVSSAVIELLISRGAKVNFETRLSKTTPLMLAIQTRRPDLVKALILADAEVDVMDATGNTPLTMATRIGGDLGTSMMSSILAADPSKNDGSLHNAARELNVRALQVLIDFGHDIDFPSPLHGGRSALGEVCLNAAHAGPLSSAQEKQMEKVMGVLIDRGTDLTIQSDGGKSALLLALHSADPLPTTRALLKVGMWKHVNRPYNNYTDGTYTYSASQYVARVLAPSEVQSQLLDLLKANRAVDIYYANDGPQPEGAVNLPEELLRAERERRAYMERTQKETEEYALQLARQKEIAQIQNQIYLQRAEIEDTRARTQRQEEMDSIKARQTLEEQAFKAALRQRKAERDAAIAHERQLTEAGLSRARMVAEAELELEESKQRKMIEWESTLGVQRLTNAKDLSAVRLREREELERFDAASDARTVKRLTEHKKLVESQNSLASKLTNAGVGSRRQIGYITGELD
ncbi:Serine/threonine-protein phosphatase [Diplogelasinospora grovesii]|uniref:Serine/threonine-protein phosphatase n=1 Tax=Diplogelasinospora grovesii TaxID=303347 RepID=A0AAN6RYX3_9PEZI|nr:Serine/threonine-protein phosphatase [Diplogelasinospora grovesii]